MLDSVSGFQTLPCGFNLVRLPFNDEISLSDPISEPPTAPVEEQEHGLGEAPALTAAKAMLNQLRIETVTSLSLILTHTLATEPLSPSFLDISL